MAEKKPEGKHEVTEDTKGRNHRDTEAQRKKQRMEIRFMTKNHLASLPP
jgi:hypothetical protein